MFTVGFNVDPFLDSWAKLERGMAESGFRAFKSAVDAASEASDQKGYKDRTGRLSNTRQETCFRSGEFSYKGQIKWPMSYAIYVDKGTRPHPIVAHSLGRPLRFFWPKVGHWVSFWKVNHPGTAAAGFSERARQHFNVRGPAVVQQGFDAAITNDH